MANLGGSQRRRSHRTFVATTAAYQLVLREASTRLDGGDRRGRRRTRRAAARAPPAAVGGDPRGLRPPGRPFCHPRLAVRRRRSARRPPPARQPTSPLNVDALASRRLPRVVASLHSREAAAYRRLHGIEPGAAAMAVGWSRGRRRCGGIAYLSTSAFPAAAGHGSRRCAASASPWRTAARRETVSSARQRNPRVDGARGRPPRRCDAGGVREEAVERQPRRRPASTTPTRRGWPAGRRCSRPLRRPDIEGEGRDGQLALLQCRRRPASLRPATPPSSAPPSCSRAARRPSASAADRSAPRRGRRHRVVPDGA
jgi:hypothetical protein